ncbi:MAG: hypothetical protein ACI9F9_001614 [Candidatus Paceibacteria bacterium]|jgi:hypothetical protein
MSFSLKTVTSTLLGLSLMGLSVAQGRRAGDSTGPPRPEPTVDWSAVDQRIAWFGTLEPALAAAKQTGRPILLVSGAPACHDVPGIW